MLKVIIGRVLLRSTTGIMHQETLALPALVVLQPWKKCDHYSWKKNYIKDRVTKILNLLCYCFHFINLQKKKKKKIGLETKIFA